MGAGKRRDTWERHSIPSWTGLCQPVKVGVGRGLMVLAPACPPEFRASLTLGSASSAFHGVRNCLEKLKKDKSLSPEGGTSLGGITPHSLCEPLIMNPDLKLSPSDPGLSSEPLL